LSKWYSLESVPKDGTNVILWVPDEDRRPFDTGQCHCGFYDSALDGYFNSSGEEIYPICWHRAISGPDSADDISFEAEEQ
jgi:hypothetical protein